MTRRFVLAGVLAMALAAFLCSFAAADVYDSYTFFWNGHLDNDTDYYGYYYCISAGALGSDYPPSPPDAITGRRPIVQIGDDPTWGPTYHRWSSAGTPGQDFIAGLALTMYDTANNRVYDNNGLDTAGTQAVIDFYAGGPPAQMISYSMVNNFDWVTAGYFHLEDDIEVKQIVGYFDEYGITQYGSDIYPDFSQDSPRIGYRMNIYSSAFRKVADETTTRLWPAVDSFYGDVFSSDPAGTGSFSWSDTGYVRLDEFNNAHSIYRLVFTLNEAITLHAGDYFFEHDAYVIPEPTTLTLVGLGLAGLGVLKRRRKR